MSVGVPHQRRTVSMTCGIDQRAHRVDDDALSAGVAGHAGRFRAVCGHSVLATSSAVQARSECLLCVTVLSIGDLEVRQRGRDADRAQPTVPPAAAAIRPPQPAELTAD